MTSAACAVAVASCVHGAQQGHFAYLAGVAAKKLVWVADRKV